MMRPSFDWDPAKDIANRDKHGVGFDLAQRAFLDPHRVIAADRGHSGDEARWFCFGRVGDGILTVRFTMRGEVVRIIGAGYWRKGRRICAAENGDVHGR